ncbi:MAG: Beta-ketoacyl-acyl-carrier-protein synthase 6-deoxyerythronolide-B synthase, partial [Firmicutes bacterium]|nr:Beta-ketoacyl-acyl-carrier-protein synthase 6-deoxyerythronolide-B synthase [Bacillota bacterium]
MTVKKDIAMNLKEIAIVGMACRFPGAPDYRTFWDNLSRGVSSIREIDRWNFNANSSPDWKNSKSIGKCCGLLDDIDKFDNNFFHISPREAIHMDPQQRILLEEAWHCIEDSGISLRELQQKRTSIYVGTVAMDLYQGLPDEKEIDIYSGTGMYRFMLANRLSYFLGLSGESIVLEAACASASVAICNAKKALQTGDCDYALVAGANLHMSPLRHQIYVKNRMLSKDGKCKTFDKDADGFVAGEGIGFLLLQPLDKAVQQQNHIFGVIKGCAVNHGGKAVSVSAPRVEAQRDVILAAYEDAEISAEKVNYIEAHGTGTSLGDPIEVEALTQAFQKFTSEKQFCKIGSVKTNIGHLEGTAGMAGVIKVLLMMRHKKIPPTLNIKTVNPIIDFKNSPFSIANELTEWKNRDGMPLRAGVSSFGLGGVNSHILLEEYPDKNTGADSANVKKYQFALSAKNEKSLEGMLDKWRSFVKSDEFMKYGLRDICLTLLTGRENLPVRYGSLISNKIELVELLDKMTPAFFNKADKSWGLCVGDFVWNSYAEFEPIIEEFPIFKEKLGKVLESIEEYDKGRKIKKGFLAATWPKSKIDLNSFIANYTCISTLVELGLSLSLITGVKSGLWASLVVSGATSLGEVIKVLCGEKAVDKIEVARPLISFYDPINKTVIKPYAFEEEYVQDLISKLEISDNVIEHYWEKAHLLSENQFTFIHFLDEWDSNLKAVGLDIKTLLADKNVLILKDEKNYKKTLLLMVVILSCLYRLNLKWNLSEHKLIKDERFYELLDLVLDDVIPKDILIALLTSEKPDLTIVIDTLKERQNKINICKSYKYLKQRSRKVTEIANVGQWIEQILLQEELVSLPDMEYFDFGKLANRNSGKEIVTFNQQKDKLTEIHEVLNSLWIRGVNVQWNRIYTETSFRKLPLPSYVFDRTSFWLPDKGKKQTADINEVVDKDAAVHKILHPLLQKNTSSFFEERFSSTFTGQEFFLKDHVIEGQKILPGVAYLEMAREAVKQALGREEKEKTKICLKNIVWIRPMSVNDQPVQVHIGLVLEDSGEISYEIYSQSKDNDVLCSRGTALLEPCSEIFCLDIKQLQEACNQKKLLSDHCYEIFKRMGFNYGKGHQGIKEIYIGTNQILARLFLPEIVVNTEKQYVLHPSVMDAALQASICLTIDDETNRGEVGKLKPLLPFALQNLKIFANCTAYMWASVRYSPDSKAGDTVQKFDIDLSDDNGKVCVQMRGFSMRSPQGEIRASSTQQNGVLMLHPQWREADLQQECILPSYVQHLVIVCETDKISAESIKNQMQNVKCITLEAKEEDIAGRFSAYAIRVFEEIQTLIKGNPKGEALIQIVISPEKEGQLYSGLSGLLKTAHLEHPKLIGQIIEIDKNDDSEKIIEQIKVNSCCPQDTQIRYHGGKRLVVGWENIENFKGKLDIPWKNQGVYLITGGSGGLGLIFAKEIADNVKGATLILTGRSELDTNKKVKLKEIEQKGIQIAYKQVDVTRKQDIEKLIQNVQEQYGKIDGIIHAAGMLRDNYIIKKTKAEFQEVLAPKVAGLVNLDQASKDVALDFFILFSSIAGSLGNLGQADYATANSFMDEFSRYRGKLVDLQLRRGKTLSINWPLWRDGGMHVDVQTEKMMMENQGMAVMQTANGIRALYQGMVLKNTQMMVLEGLIDRMRRKVLKQVDGAMINPIDKSAAAIDNGALLEKVQANLIQGVSKLLGVAIEDVDTEVELSEYGFDSITFTEFTNQLNQEYKIALTPTIFFEHPTLSSFAEYLLDEYRMVFGAPQLVTPTESQVNTASYKSGAVIDGGALLEKVQANLIQGVSKLLG